MALSGGEVPVSNVGIDLESLERSLRKPRSLFSYAMSLMTGMATLAAMVPLPQLSNSRWPYRIGKAIYQIPLITSLVQVLYWFSGKPSLMKREQCFGLCRGKMRDRSELD